MTLSELDKHNCNELVERLFNSKNNWVKRIELPSPSSYSSQYALFNKYDECVCVFSNIKELLVNTMGYNKRLLFNKDSFLRFLKTNDEIKEASKYIEFLLEIEYNITTCNVSIVDLIEVGVKNLYPNRNNKK